MRHRSKRRIVGLMLTLLLGSAVANAATRSVLLRSGFERPLYVTHAGDTRLFIVEQTGRVLSLDLANVALGTSVFLDIRALVSSTGERGLLSIAFHPDYSLNGFFYVNYTNLAGNTVVARYTVSTNPNQANPSSGVTLLTIPQPFANHNGGQLQIGPGDGYLYVGMGDGGSAGDPQCNAQTTAGGNLLGKMLRLDIRQNQSTPPYYGIPADNPYASTTDGVADEILSIGLRNPWRFSFDRATGDLYIADVGQNSWEEIHYSPAGTFRGLNYGWNVMEGSHCFTGGSCGPGTPVCNAPGLTLPVFEYSHTDGCSITGGYVYRGSRAPELTGSYVFTDYCTPQIQTLRRVGSSWQRQIVTTVSGNPRSFGESADGGLYVTSGDSVYELVSDPVVRVPVLGSNDRHWLWFGLSAVALSLAAYAAMRRAKSGSTNEGSH